MNSKTILHSLSISLFCLILFGCKQTLQYTIPEEATDIHRWKSTYTHAVKAKITEQSYAKYIEDHKLILCDTNKFKGVFWPGFSEAPRWLESVDLIISNTYTTAWSDYYNYFFITYQDGYLYMVRSTD